MSVAIGRRSQRGSTPDEGTEVELARVLYEEAVMRAKQQFNQELGESALIDQLASQRQNSLLVKLENEGG